MDDSNPPTYNVQVESQDGCHPGDSAERRVTHLPSASDENENQLDGDGPELLTSSGSAMGKAEVLEQDSLNNNESCMSSCEVAASESSEGTLCEHPKEGQDFLGRDKRVLGKRSTKSKKGTIKKIPPDNPSLIQEKILSAATYAVGDDETAEVNANDQPEAPKLALQSLFSLIRGEVEQLDSRALPLCLHQIAELYFQEEDYEKAMKFIQLERLYHEQLLANLSAIQEQWEAKWKTLQPHIVTPLRNSEKGFNGEDFEQLAKFCSTHQDPLLSKHKTEAIEKSLERKCFTQLKVSEESQAKGATAKASESETCLGMEPSVESQHKEEPQKSSADHSQMDSLAYSLSLSVTAGKDHTEEPLCSTESSLELHAQSSETAGSSSGPDSAENACEAINCLQEAPIENCPDVATLEAIADDPKVLPSSESVIEPLILPGCDHIPPVLISEGKFSQTQRKELHLPLQDASKAVPVDQPENNELNELSQPDLTDSDGKSPQSQTDSEIGSQNVSCGNNKISDLSILHPEVYMAPEEKGDKEDQVGKETEDYLNSLLEGCLKGTEDSLSYEDNQDDDSDLLQDLSPEEASYSLQESLPSDDSCLSLDDLAKRIEVAEVVPAEGLVSILKKRNDSVGDHPAQMQQKPSKRRVRFQEIDDNLDQDEVGGSSCILLILLCIATVFLSIGGTALYCTFGDMESPVCTDFAENVDFYYTKFLQGMAEVKHWIYLS